MSAYSPTVSTDAAAYAAAVRQQLDDLAPDVVEELSGGLEADLAELAAESDTPLAQRLGDPAAYAAELRASAELPPRTTPRAGATHSLAAELARAREQWAQTSQALSRTAWWGPVSGAVTSLRPAWWLLRAWVALQLLQLMGVGIAGALPDGPVGWTILLGLMAGSVALGRGWLRGNQLVRWGVVVGNVVAVLLLPAALDEVTYGASPVLAEPVYMESYQPGLVLDGQPIANLFPYDANGQPLQGVQLLDDRGRPVETAHDIREFPTGDGGWLTLVPAEGPNGEQLWNVFPLKESRADESGNRPWPGSPVTEAPRPRPTLEALGGTAPGPTSPPTATATAAAPTSSPTEPASAPTTTTQPPTSTP